MANRTTQAPHTTGSPHGGSVGAPTPNSALPSSARPRASATAAQVTALLRASMGPEFRAEARKGRRYVTRWYAGTLAMSYYGEGRTWAEAVAQARARLDAEAAPRCFECARTMAPHECGDELPEERVCDTCARVA